MLTLSRVADTLYWMSRYIERAEHTARLLDLQLHLMLDGTPQSAVPRMMRVLSSLGVTSPDEPLTPYLITHLLTFDTLNTQSIVSSVAAAREGARHVREQISSEMWEQINRLYHQVRSTDIDRLWNDQPHMFFTGVKDGCHLFQGITDSTMANGEGWQFIQLGRSMERALSMARLLDVHYTTFGGVGAGVMLERDTITSDFMEWTALLKSCTAFEAYCKVYTADLRADRIAEFLILNSEFPHTIRYSVNRMASALAAITDITETKRAKHVNRLVGRLRAMVDYGHVDEIFVGGLHQFLEGLQQNCFQVHESVYQAFVLYPADEFVMAG